MKTPPAPDLQLDSPGELDEAGYEDMHEDKALRRAALKIWVER